MSITQIFELILTGVEMFIKGMAAAAGYVVMLTFEVIKQEPWIIAVIVGAITIGMIRRKLRV